MKRGLIFFLVAGLAIAGWLVVYFGADAVGRAFMAAGWKGIAAVCVIHSVPTVLCGEAWRILLGGTTTRGTAGFAKMRWVRDGVSNLASLLPVSGELAAARLLMHEGIGLGLAGASVVVDMTMELLSQLVFTLLGLALLAVHRPDDPIVTWALVGLAVAAPATIGFFVAQRRGLFRFIESLPGKLAATWHRPEFSERGLHAGLERIHARRGRLVAAFSLHLLAWLTGVAEAWAALWFMGIDLPASQVIALESLAFAVRSAAFVVPGAIGVQEGAYVLLGAVFGLGPDAALAVSLIKRAREVVLGVPALIAWQIQEGHLALRGRRP